MKKYTTVITTTHGKITCEGTMIHNLAVAAILEENNGSVVSVVHDAELTKALEDAETRQKISSINESMKEIYDADRDYEMCFQDLSKENKGKYLALRHERQTLIANLG